MRDCVAPGLGLAHAELSLPRPVWDARLRTIYAEAGLGCATASRPASVLLTQHDDRPVGLGDRPAGLDDHPIEGRTTGRWIIA